MIVEAIVLFVVALLTFLYFSQQHDKTNAPEALSGIPILGASLGIMGNFGRFDEFLDDFRKKLGPTYVVRPLDSPMIFVTVDPANVEHILRVKFNNYVKGPFFSSKLFDVLGHGIFNADGELWKTQRKLTSTLFNVSNFQNGMMSVFVDHGKDLVEVLDTYDNKIVDAHNVFHRFTLDSIGAIAFGEHIGSLKNPEVPFAQAWDRTNATLTQRFFTPFIGILKYIIPGERRLASELDVIKSFSRQIIAERRREFATNPDYQRSDLLSMYLVRKDDNGEEFSDEFLVDMVLNVILAGRDTTAQSLSWTLWLLLQNPAILEKLTKEIDDTIGQGALEYRTIQNMKYMYAVISESLRLYPSVPRDPKTALEADTLPDGTIVPKGAMVVYFPYGMGRSTEIWGPDAAEFKPERFLNKDDSDGIVKPSPFKFAVFQAGYRTCLGQNMAYLEESVVLILLLRRYKVSLVPNQDIRIALNLTCPMQNGLLVKLEKRKDVKLEN